MSDDTPDERWSNPIADAYALGYAAGGAAADVASLRAVLSALCDAFDSMERYESAGGDGWWRGYDSIKAARAAAVSVLKGPET